MFHPRNFTFKADETIIEVQNLKPQTKYSFDVKVVASNKTVIKFKLLEFSTVQANFRPKIIKVVKLIEYKKYGEMSLSAVLEWEKTEDKICRSTVLFRDKSTDDKFATCFDNTDEIVQVQTIFGLKTNTEYSAAVTETVGNCSETPSDLRFTNLIWKTLQRSTLKARVFTDRDGFYTMNVTWDKIHSDVKFYTLSVFDENVMEVYKNARILKVSELIFKVIVNNLILFRIQQKFRSATFH